MLHEGFPFHQLCFVYQNKCIKYISKLKFIQAGISNDQLTLAYEPEVAAIYCKEVKIAQASETQKELKGFSPGSRYMVIDLGGRLNTISVYSMVQIFKTFLIA